MRGILIDVLTEALQNRMKISISHKGYPWARAQYMVKYGTSDAFTTIPTPERREYTKISDEAVLNAKIKIFVRIDNPKLEKVKNIKQIADLQNFTLGNFIGSGWAKKNLSKFSVDWARSLHLTLLKLKGKRFDLYVGSSFVTKHIIKSSGLEKEIIEIPQPLDSVLFKLCIGKKSSYINILPEFDQVIKKMREEGVLTKIYDKYK